MSAAELPELAKPPGFTRDELAALDRSAFERGAMFAPEIEAELGREPGRIPALRAMHDYARDQLRLVDPPRGTAFGRFLAALGKENERLRRDLREERERRWSVEGDLAATKARLSFEENKVRRLTVDLTRALHLTGHPRAPELSPPSPPAKPTLPPRPLYVPADAPEERFAPTPTSNPQDRLSVPERRDGEDRRQVTILLLALSHRELLADDLQDVVWAGPLSREASAWLGRDEPLPRHLREKLEERLLPSDRALLQPEADPVRVRATFDQALGRERIDILRAEVAAMVNELGDDAEETEFDRLTALQTLIAEAERRLVAAAMELDNG